MKNENQQLKICQASCRRLVEKQVETKVRHEERRKTLEQILIDWEDDADCSPHRVHDDAIARAMFKVLERLYNVVWNMDDTRAPSWFVAERDAQKRGPTIDLNKEAEIK
jgi:hypothetical protein